MDFREVLLKDFEVVAELRMDLKGDLRERRRLVVLVLVRNDAAVAEVLLVSCTDVVLLHLGMNSADIEFGCVLVHVGVDELFVEPLCLIDIGLLNPVH